jgi:hypothetical protein
MEQERGAFKVKLPNRPTQLRNGSEFTGSIFRTAADLAPNAKLRAGILVKSPQLHKK